MAFCGKCGTQVADGAAFCGGCGSAVSVPQGVGQTDNSAIPKAVASISFSQKLCGISWIAVASFQALLFLISLLRFGNISDVKEYTVAAVFLICAVSIGIISALNFIVGFKSFKSQKGTVDSPVDVMKRYRKQRIYIGPIIYNMVFFIIVLAASLWYGYVANVSKLTPFFK